VTSISNSFVTADGAVYRNGELVAVLTDAEIEFVAVQRARGRAVEIAEQGRGVMAWRCEWSDGWHQVVDHAPRASWWMWPIGRHGRLFRCTFFMESPIDGSQVPDDSRLGPYEPSRSPKDKPMA